MAPTQESPSQEDPDEKDVRHARDALNFLEHNIDDWISHIRFILIAPPEHLTDRNVRLSIQLLNRIRRLGNTIRKGVITRERQYRNL